MIREKKSEFGGLNANAIKSMTLLDWCIKESQRLSGARDGVNRFPMEDLEYKGYYLLRGSTVRVMLIDHSAF